jgi:hypothetical protein
MCTYVSFLSTPIVPWANGISGTSQDHTSSVSTDVAAHYFRSLLSCRLIHIAPSSGDSGGLLSNRYGVSDATYMPYHTIPYHTIPYRHVHCNVRRYV